MSSKGGTKLIATNKKAYHEYFVDDKSTSRIATAPSRIMRSLSTECISAHTKKAIYLTATRYAQGSCLCTNVR